MNALIPRGFDGFFSSWNYIIVRWYHSNRILWICGFNILNFKILNLNSNSKFWKSFNEW